MRPHGIRIWLAAFTVLAVVLGLESKWRCDGLALYQEFSRHHLEEAAGQPLTYPPAPPIFLDNDSYMWVRMAKRMATNGEWRVRVTEVDNAPYGREVHWSSGFAWYLVLLGRLDRTFAGGEIDQAIERAAVWANPLLLLIVMFFAGLVVCARAGPQPAVFIMLGLMSSPQLFWTFYTGRPDHHGIISAAAMGTVLCLLMGGAGWVYRDKDPYGLQPASVHSARRWFVASAVLGAIGLWTSAVSMTVVLAICCISGMAVSLITPKKDHLSASAEPALWRLWGGVGAGLSLVFYLLEYAPNHMAMRLEVNHPFYALAWLSGSELVCRVWKLRRKMARLSPGEAIVLLLSLAGVAVLPLAVWMGGANWYTLRDPFMWRLHAFIDEFLPYFRAVGDTPWVALGKDFGLYLVMAVIGLVLIPRRTTSHSVRAALCFAGIPAALLGAMTCWQYRWSSLFAGVLLVFLVVCVQVVQANGLRAGRRSHLQPFVLALVVAQFVYFTTDELSAAWNIRTRRIYPKSLVRSAILRDVAQEIHKRAGTREVVVLSSPGETTQLCYWGDFTGIASFYWENVQGLEDAARIYTTASDEEARRLLRERGVTHIVLYLESNYVGEYMTALRGSFDEEALSEVFAWRLIQQPTACPRWLLPLVYQMPFREFHGFPGGVLVFELADTDPAEGSR